MYKDTKQSSEAVRCYCCAMTSIVMLACVTSAVPTAPRDIVIKTPRQGEMHIRWKPPLQPNGIVTHYYVRWQPNALSAKNVYDLRDYCGTYDVYEPA